MSVFCKLHALSALFTCLTLVTIPALALDEWAGTTGDWFLDSNWKDGSVPTVGDIVIINNGGTAQVGTTGAVAGFLAIGDFLTGNLVISAGGTLSNSVGRIGNFKDSNGSVIVDGPGSSWSNSAFLIIGNDGSGSLTIQSSGVVNVSSTLTLADSGSAIGTLNIGDMGAAGVLNATSVNSGAGTATLNFNHTDGIYFFTRDGSSSGGAIAITGTTSVNHNGSGTTFLDGMNTYSGATTINGGSLFINGSNGNSTTTVNVGGTLGGTGTVGSVNVSGGTFAPGNSIGTTNVAGNVDFTGGGIYQVEVNDAGNSDLINATGTATLTSGIVQVLPEAGAYNFSSDYTILTAGGGLGGTTFNSVTSNLAFLDPTLSYDANNVFLTLTRNDVGFSSVAETPNQTEVSDILMTLGATNPAEMQDLLNSILSLTDAGARQAFDSLSGVQHTHGQLLTNKLSQQFLHLILNRGSQSRSTQYAFNSQQFFNPMSGPLLADNSNNWQTYAAAESSSNQYGSVTPERGWWLQGFGGFGDIDDTSNASGADYDTVGLAFGVDTEWRDMVIGVAGSYASSDADTFGGDLDIDSYQLAGYGTWQIDGQSNAIYINAAIGFGYYDTDSSRRVTVGTASSIATSDYDSYSISAAVETGKDIALSADTTLTPFIGIDYGHSSRDDFTETGAGTANLSFDDKDEDSLRTNLGLRLSHNITTKSDTRITPYASVAYVREYMDNVARIDAGFAVAPSPTFRIDGPDLDRDRAHIGLGVVGEINERTTLNIAYNGEFADSDDNHNFAATIRFVW